MDQLERFLVISSSGDVTTALDFRALETLGPEARTTYLGSALQKVLKQYTNAAASYISDMLSFISRFVVQVGIFCLFSMLFQGGRSVVNRCGGHYGSCSNSHSHSF